MGMTIGTDTVVMLAEELKSIRKEQGCNGPVTEAMNRLEEHLNQAAHDEEG